MLGLPRGGVPVAFEVAEALGVPLDIVVVRKLRVPFQPELAMGAIGEGGVRVINRDVVEAAGVSEIELAAIEHQERRELDRRARQLRGDVPRVPIAQRTVVIIDDGIATGATVRAACSVARAEGAGQVVIAVPVAPPGALATLAGVADEVVFLFAPQHFSSVGEAYDDFLPTEDREVLELLGRASTRSITRPDSASRNRLA